MAYDNEIAAMTIFCEASGATQDERIAVAWTIVNRLKDGRFGKTIAEVCLKRMQFSEWNDDAGDNANLRRAARAADDDPVLAECSLAYGLASTGTGADPTGGATHYYDKSISRPYWTERATLALETPKFFFYKDVP